MKRPHERIKWWPERHEGYRIGYLETAFGYGAAYESPPDELGTKIISLEGVGKSPESSCMKTRAKQLVERAIAIAAMVRLSGGHLSQATLDNVKLVRPDTLWTVVIRCDKSQPSKKRTKATKSDTPKKTGASTRRGAKTARRGRAGP